MFEGLNEDLQLAAGYNFSGAIFDLSLTVGLLIILSIIKGLYNRSAKMTDLDTNIAGAAIPVLVLGFFTIKQAVNEKKGTTTSVKESTVRLSYYDTTSIPTIKTEYNLSDSLFDDSDTSFINPVQTIPGFDEFDYVGYFVEGKAPVRKNDLWGYADSYGNIVIQVIYRDASYFSEGFANVRNDEDLYGFIDANGNEICSFMYDFAGDFSEGLARVRIGKTVPEEKWGYIDQYGNEVIPLQFQFAGNFKNGYAEVKINDQWKYIDKNGMISDSKDSSE